MVGPANVPSPLPSSTDTVSENQFVVTRSGLASPFRSPAATDTGLSPAPNDAGAAKLTAGPLATAGTAVAATSATQPTTAATNPDQMLVGHRLLSARGAAVSFGLMILDSWNVIGRVLSDRGCPVAELWKLPIRPAPA